MTKPAEERKILARNRKALHDYEIGERFEAGLVLQGSEIKEIRAGRMSLQDSYVQPQGDGLWLLNAHIPPYDQARNNHDPRRPRKLLLHRKEIHELTHRVQERGYTLIPLLVYLVKGRAKVEIALARGRKQYDKRKVLAEKDHKRDIERALRER